MRKYNSFAILTIIILNAILTLCAFSHGGFINPEMQIMIVGDYLLSLMTIALIIWTSRPMAA